MMRDMPDDIRGIRDMISTDDAAILHFEQRHIVNHKDAEWSDAQ